jgi:hypothetical protein
MTYPGITVDQDRTEAITAGEIEPHTAERTAFETARLIQLFSPNSWIVLWHSHQHGGLHYRLDDAVAHQRRLLAAPAWDQLGWVESLRDAA